jgi:hypothetical protein
VAGSDVGSGIIQLNVLANTVVNQPAMPTVAVPALTDVGSQLVTAQGHAKDWLYMYSKELWNCLQDIISYGETFNNLYVSLSTAAKSMAQDNKFQPNQIASLILMMQELQALVKQPQADATAVYQALTAYSTAVAADHTAFVTDFNAANVALGGTSGAIAKLTKKIAADNQALKTDLQLLGAGPTAIVTGMLVVAVGILGEIETAGVATALVVGGVAIIAGGATATGLAGTNYDSTMTALQADQAALAADNTALTLLTGLKGQLDGLANTLETTYNTLGNLITGWGQIENGLQSVINDLNNPEGFLAFIQKNDPNANPGTVSGIIVAQIETAQEDWINAVKIANSYLTKGRQVQYVSTAALPTQQAIAQAALAAGVAGCAPRPTLAA